MTIETTTVANSYIGNGALTNFVYDAKIQVAADLVVTLDGVVQTSGYTVNGAGDAGGGSVDFAAAPATDVVVGLRRNVRPLKQQTDLVAYSRNRLDAIEDALDRQVMAYQEFAADNALNAADFGASPDSGASNNAPAINAAIDEAAAYGKKYVLIPGGDGIYGVDEPIRMRHGVIICGEGNGTHVKNYTTGTTWDAVPVLAGTYGAFQVAAGANSETSYDIADAARTDSVLTFDTGADAANFSVGDIVCVEDPSIYSSGGNDYPIKAQLTEVIAVGAADITVSPRLTDDYVDNGTKPRVYRLNTGNVPGIDGTGAGFVLNRGGLCNMTIESSNTRSMQVIHLSAYNCRFDRLRVIGSAALIGNPNAYNTFTDVKLEYGRLGLELAYWGNNNKFVRLRARRTSDTDDASLSGGLLLNVDGGADNDFIDCDLDEFTLYANGGVGVNFAKRRSRWINGNIVHTADPSGPSSAMQIAGEGSGIGDESSITGAYIHSSGANGIVSDGKRCHIKNNRFGVIGAAYDCVRLKNGNSQQNIVTDNFLGGVGDTGGQYAIRDDGGTGHVIRDNI